MVGKYRHTVDPKGRLFVPAKLRTELGDAFVFAVLIVVLLVKPTGLLGKQVQEKV